MEESCLRALVIFLIKDNSNIRKLIDARLLRLLTASS
jgi:hypothetical protein